MRSVFDLFDSNHDGTICVSELMKLMQSCGQNPTDKDVEEIMKSVDKNGKSSAFAVLEFFEPLVIVLMHVLK